MPGNDLFGTHILVKGVSMPPHDELFGRLQDVAELNRLVGKTEDLYLDCKIWPPKDEEAQRMLAKALCGFANADGGVIVIGFEARGGPAKHDPDIIQRSAPVEDAIFVKSRVEGLIGDLVEPRLQGIVVIAIPEAPNAKSGFVLIGVPPTDGLPTRSRKDHKFYQRISSGTYPMEYFQIADMFGKRHRPLLFLHLEEGLLHQVGHGYERELTVGMENRGRAVARFPSIRFKCARDVAVSPFGIDGNHGFGLPRRPTEAELTLFGGGADHVVYAGTTLKIAKLEQRAVPNPSWAAVRGGRKTFYFEEYTLIAEIAADEVQSLIDSKTILRKDIPLD
jgi:Putative DNA-binding domain